MTDSGASRTQAHSSSSPGSFADVLASTAEPPEAGSEKGAPEDAGPSIRPAAADAARKADTDDEAEAESTDATETRDAVTESPSGSSEPAEEEADAPATAEEDERARERQTAEGALESVDGDAQGESGADGKLAVDSGAPPQPESQGGAESVAAAIDGEPVVGTTQDASGSNGTAPAGEGSGAGSAPAGKQASAERVAGGAPSTEEALDEGVEKGSGGRSVGGSVGRAIAEQTDKDGDTDGARTVARTQETIDTAARGQAPTGKEAARARASGADGPSQDSAEEDGTDSLASEDVDSLEGDSSDDSHGGGAKSGSSGNHPSSSSEGRSPQPSFRLEAGQSGGATHRGANDPTAPAQRAEASGSEGVQSGNGGSAAARGGPAEGMATPPADRGVAAQAARVEQALNATFQRGYVNLRHDDGTMRLTVQREGLGQLEVHVAVRDSAVHASIGAGHEEARHALNSQRADLEQALQKYNLKLDSFNVDVGGRGDPSTRDREAEARAQRARSWAAPGEEGRHVPEAATAAVPERLHAGALSVRV